MLLAPFRVVPESSLRIMRTQLTVLLLLPAAAGWMLFGYQALKLMLVAVVGAGIAEVVCSRLRHLKVPGSMEHSLMMGLLLAFMLPAHASWYIVLIGAAAAVLLGKQFFGGLGHYLWHPALVGRVVVELFFHEKVSAASGPILNRASIFLGNLNGVMEEGGNWFKVNWFTSEPPSGTVGYILERPVEALRNFGALQLGDTGAQMGQYMLTKLPSLEHCLIGAVPGGIGETCAIALILACLYLVYRGYMHWLLPMVFIMSASLGAMILPILVERDGSVDEVVMLPILAENISVGFTYVNYQLFSGGLLLGACILAGDMTSRPITVRGQVVYGAGAGFIAMIFRLYTPLAIPTYGAILVMNTLVPSIDRLTRRRGPKSSITKR